MEIITGCIVTAFVLVLIVLAVLLFRSAMKTKRDLDDCSGCDGDTELTPEECAEVKKIRSGYFSRDRGE